MSQLRLALRLRHLLSSHAPILNTHAHSNRHSFHLLISVSKCLLLKIKLINQQLRPLFLSHLSQSPLSFHLAPMHGLLLCVDQYSECSAIACMILVEEVNIELELGTFLFLCCLELHFPTFITRVIFQILFFLKSLGFLGLAALLLLDGDRGSLRKPHIVELLGALSTGDWHFESLAEVDVCVLGHHFDEVLENDVVLFELLLQPFNLAVDLELLLLHRIKLE